MLKSTHRSFLRLSGTVLTALILLCDTRGAEGAEFSCTAGDVACLIAAIHEANLNGEVNTIALAAGTYLLRDVDNNINGANGLPSIAGQLTIAGGAESTIIERDAASVFFRIMHIAPTGTLALIGITITGGISAGRGGGIFNAGTLSLTDTTIRNNDAEDGGGGIWNENATVTISQSQIIGNHQAFGNGGGIASQGVVIIDQSVISHNFSDFAGGGIAAGGTLIITGSSISANGATSSGGISSGGQLAISDSTISGNFSRDFAGGVSAAGTWSISNTTIANNVGHGVQNGGVGILSNTTISGHSGSRGVGLLNGQGTVELQNTLIALNSSDCEGLVTSLGHNLIGDPTGCSIDLQATDLTGDPGLDEYTEDEDDAGSGHFPLLPDSQAINAGNRATCPATDQLGNPRVGRCDIGAVEFQGRKVRLIVRREVIRAGRSLTVRWRNIPEPAPTDWIGLYSPGSPNTAFLEWIYVSCSTTPADPRPRGSCHFTVPASLVAGTYELRLLADDGYEHLASSHTFTVKEP